MATTKPKPKVLNKTIDGMEYTILEQTPENTIVQRKVEAFEIAYDVLGFRYDTGRVILDHIPTGRRIASFRNETKARNAMRELILVTDFKWTEPPVVIRDAVAAILKRWAL